MIALSRNHARCFLVWASLTALVVMTQSLALDSLRAAAGAAARQELSSQSFEQLLVWLCSALAVGCGAWCWLASSLVVLDTARGRTRSRSRGCPEVLRRWLLVACGVAVAGSVAASPAYAAPAPDPTSPPHQWIAGLPLPERVGIGWSIRSPAPAGPTIGAPTQYITVRPGDSLWTIASRSSGPGSRAAAINTAWRALYELNRATIGPDPDLIHPGLRLRIPNAGQE